MTLLEKAVAATTTPSKVSEMELAELAIAWADGSIRNKDVLVAMGVKNSSIFYSKMAVGLRGAVRLGLLVKP